MSTFYAPHQDLIWPYDNQPPFQPDSGGLTTLRFDGKVWHWSCYEWGEVNRKRQATDAEVIDTLTFWWVAHCEQTKADEKATNLGKAMIAAFRKTMNGGE